MAWSRVVTLSFTSSDTVKSVTGLPGTPVAIFCTSMQGTGVQSRPSASMGICSGTSAQACAATRHTLNTGASAENGYYANDAIAVTYNGFSPRTFAVTTIAIDGFTVTASATPEGTTVLSFLVVGGAGVGADVHTSTAASGTYNRTGLAGQPSVVLGLLSHVGGGVGFGGTVQGAHLSLLVFDGATRRAHAMFAEDGASTSVTKSAARTSNGLAAAANGTTLTNDPQTTISSINSDGYTWTQASGSNQCTMWLALWGIDAKLLTTTVQSSTGAQALTGAGFAVDAALAIVSPLSTTNDATLANHATIGVGFAQGSDARGAAVLTAHGMSADTEAQCMQAADALVYAMERTGTDTYAERAVADVSAWGADGLTLDWTNADATAGLVTILVLGGAASGAVHRVYYSRIKRFF